MNAAKNIHFKCMHCIIHSVGIETGLFITIALELKFSAIIIAQFKE